MGNPAGGLLIAPDQGRQSQERISGESSVGVRQDRIARMSPRSRDILILRGLVRKTFRLSYLRYRFRSISFVLWEIVVRQIAPGYDTESGSKFD
jgi:hypothetical protein